MAVTLDANGGVFADNGSSMTILRIKDSTFGEVECPTRVGYTMTGWFTAADGGT